MMGTTPEQAAEQLLAAGADVIGSNCGQGIAGLVEICRRLQAATDRPVWIKANAGLPEIVDGKTVYRADARASSPPTCRNWSRPGAGFLGGCCGTTPEFIRAVAERLGRVTASTVRLLRRRNTAGVDFARHCIRVEQSPP